jgi:hypothetical protein
VKRDDRFAGEKKTHFLGFDTEGILLRKELSRKLKKGLNSFLSDNFLKLSAEHSDKYFIEILVWIEIGMAGETGLEPAASGVTSRRYNQLNYSPAFSKTKGFINISREDVNIVF